MAFRSIKLPDIGEGVAEAEVVEWHVKVGDAVREDQTIAAVMTDKATVEIPSPVDGTVTALGAEAGQMLAVGAELVRLDVSSGAAAKETPPEELALAATAPGDAKHEKKPPHRELAAEKPEASAVKSISAARHEGESRFAEPRPSNGPNRTPPSIRPMVGLPRGAGEKPIASPAVRRRALEAGVDLRQVRGTGPSGRILHDDLDAFIRGGEQSAPAGRARVANMAIEEVKVIGLRRRIAQKMADAKRRAAHFSYVEEVDVTALDELRAALNKRADGARPKLTFIPFLIQALVRTLPEFPQMNALYDDDAEVVHRHGGVHVGIATQTPSGLMVPVVRHAEARDLWDLATEVKRLADAARAGLARRDELSGSTITITSLGPLGGIVTTPVLNRPEVAIIGVNKQVVRPVWKDNAFVPRLMMNLSSSFDHRVVDGYDAARFIQAVKGLLETPAAIFIDS
ncbi:MAG: dihydrolipoamide acetyltransferase family protein [Variibacter sp.]